MKNLKGRDHLKNLDEDERVILGDRSYRNRLEMCRIHSSGI